MDARRLRKVLADIPPRYEDPKLPHKKYLVVDDELQKEHIQKLLKVINEEENVIVVTAAENATTAYGMNHGVSGSKRTSGWDAVTLDHAIKNANPV